MKNLKSALIYSLLFIANFTLAQTKLGTINVDGKEVTIYYSLPATVVTSPVVTPPVIVQPPVVVTPPATSTGAKIASYRYEADKGFVLTFKINNQTPQEISWDGSKYYPFSVVYLPAGNTSSYYLKSGGTISKIKVIAGAWNTAPTIEGSEPESQPVTESTPTQPQQVVSPTYTTDFAEIGVTYESPVNARLLLPSHNNDADAQEFFVKKDGKTIYAFNRPQGWRPESSYWGNHPRETQHALAPGNYDFYFKNTGPKPIIVGITSGDQYAFYNFPEYLQKTEYHKRLLPGEANSFSMYIYDKYNKSSLIGSWDKKSNNYFLTCTFYENGQVTTDEVKVKDLPNGLEIPEYGTNSYTFYKNQDPSKNITIQFITNGTGQNAKFKVIQKNGLDINPAVTMVTCYNTSHWKVFNNNSEGYVGSPDYKQK